MLGTSDEPAADAEVSSFNLAKVFFAGSSEEVSMGDQLNCTGKGFVCSCSSSNEEDEDEESSSSSRLDISGELDSTCSGSSDTEESVDHFRQNLRKTELSERVQSKIAEYSKERLTCKSDEKKLLAAKELFQMGVQCEQQGRMQEAVRHYKQSLLIEPSIERKLYGQTIIQKSDYARNVRKRNSSTRKSRTSCSGCNIAATSEELIQKIYQRLANVSKLWRVCAPNVEQHSTHISALPVEILMQIFRLVVSADLDVAQLEQLSMVCGGFYCLARNSDLWHAICAKIWKSRLGPLPSNVISWREVYMNRAHLHFNGLYVSKASYVRMGERCSRDQFYNPWHVVVHYRYLRFFSDGSVLMITTADPPRIVVPLMRTKVVKHATAIIGQFTVDGFNCISMSFKRVTNGSGEVIRGGRVPVALTSTQSLLMELQLENAKHGQYNFLSWVNYQVMFKYKSAPEVVSKCCLNDKDFPPFNFYRVKSFSHYTDWFRNRKERLKHVSMPIELYRPTSSTSMPATTAIVTMSPESTSADLDIFQKTTEKSVHVAEGYPDGNIPERIVRIRIHMIARRVQLESVQRATAGHMVDVYTARMRWTEPDRWNDAELDHSERYYDLKCWLSMEGSKSRMVVNRRLSAQFNGCSEKFRFPTTWALTFQCAVRPVNGRGNVGLWTLSKRIQVQQIPVYLPGISGVDVRRLTESEIKRILETARLLVDTWIKEKKVSSLHSEPLLVRNNALRCAELRTGFSFGLQKEQRRDDLKSLNDYFRKVPLKQDFLKPKPDENANVVDNPKNSTTVDDNAKPDGNEDEDQISSDENAEPENIDDIEYLPGNIVKLHEQEFGFHDGDIAGVVYTGEEYITGFKYVTRKWPDHKIPYIIDPSYSDKERRFIESSMRTVEKDTCIKFVNRTNEPYFLRVTNTKKGCYSYIGNQQTIGGQILSLESSAERSCMDRKVISHVLLHAVGFWHEHNRVGRRKKLFIKYQSVRPEKIVYFQVLDPEYDPFHYLRYDQNSIMHYPPHAWGKPEQSTMQPSNFLASTWIGKTRYLTNDDRYKIKQLYGCLKYPKITSQQAA
ncbi:F-box only protein 9 [Trichinella pseudospiralis]|uniref:Metalloendopeptidase n=1 Tax=Trichinella pseudospiralis TaxID=6337 RepID=A0A0V1JUK0_TRIPS|nr:F-box only protein 9 [Trichinella pseudospiralis]